MSRTPFDTFCKDLALAVLTARGDAESDQRLAADPQYADLRLTVDRDRARGGARDLLSRMGDCDALFEFARTPPDVAEVASWQRKQLTWFQTRINASRRASRAPSSTPPVLWGVSSGPPLRAMQAWRLTPMPPPWPPGCYDGAPAGTLRLVVISELPRTRDTLLLRMMGAGQTFRDAVRDLESLPLDAPERTLVAEPLMRLMLEIDDDPTLGTEETLRDTRKLARELLDRHYAMGRDEGLDEGRRVGLDEGRRVALREAIVDALDARGQSLSDAQRATLDAESRVDVLRLWLTRAVTVDRVDDVFARD